MTCPMVWGWLKHVSHVLGKLGATNRTEAVARARQLAIVPRC